MKVALITGADSGIGRAVAIAFAREGANVILSYLPEEEQDGQKTAEWVQKAGRKAFVYPGDLRDERFCKELISAAITEFGTIDLLVNIAAFQNTHEELEQFTLRSSTGPSRQTSTLCFGSAVRPFQK